MNFKYCVAVAFSAAIVGVAVTGCSTAQPGTPVAAPAATLTATPAAVTAAPAAPASPVTTVITSVVTVTAPGVDAKCAGWWTAVANYRVLVGNPDAGEQEVFDWMVANYLPTQPKWATETDEQHQQDIADAKARMSSCHVR